MVRLLRLYVVLPIGLMLLATPVAAAPIDEVLALLRAADRARQTDADEAQRWAEEQARLDLLLTTVNERIEAARRRRKTAAADLQALQAEKPTAPKATLATGAVDVAGRIDRALDLLSQRVPPGLVPPRGSRRADPEEALDQALHRLERAERGVRTVEVSIAPGWLDGEPRSVEVLRLGGVAAWWRSLDGAAAGEAEMADGRLRLFAANDKAVRKAIETASAIAKGRRAPEITLLPVAHARTSTKSEHAR